MKLYTQRLLQESQKPRLPVGKHQHIPDSHFDPKELKMGIKIEMEHTDNPLISKEIAKDHLMECKTYYTRLKKMEQKCEQDEKP